MKKIVIIGSPGAGKSTLAQALHRILKIEVFHLDYYFLQSVAGHFWNFGWKKFSRKDRIEYEQEHILTKDQWIIEGTYLSSSDSRLNAADTIIFLDMPCFLCFQQAVQRYIKYQGYVRPDIPSGCTERLSLAYILKILVFPYRGRKLFLKKIAAIREHNIQLKILDFSHGNRELLRQQIAAFRAYEVDASREKLVLLFQSKKQVDDFLWGLATKKQKNRLLTRSDKQSRSFLQELIAKKPEEHAHEASKPGCIGRPILEKAALLNPAIQA